MTKNPPIGMAVLIGDEDRIVVFTGEYWGTWPSGAPPVECWIVYPTAKDLQLAYGWPVKDASAFDPTEEYLRGRKPL